MEGKSGMQFVASKIAKLKLSNPFYTWKPNNSDENKFDMKIESKFLKNEKEVLLGEVVIKMNIDVSQGTQKLTLNIESHSMFSFCGLSEDEAQSLLKYNAPTIAYSNLRASIISLTSQMYGGSPLTLPVLNIVQVIDSQE